MGIERDFSMLRMPENILNCGLGMFLCFYSPPHDSALCVINNNYYKLVTIMSEYLLSTTWRRKPHIR